MQIALITQSKRVTDPAVYRDISIALTRQLAFSVAPLWHRLSVPVIFHPDPTTVPAGSWTLAVVDNPDQAGALGYHTEDPGAQIGGQPYVHGFVFVDPVLDNGGTDVVGENSVSAVTSHEACELFIDPNCQMWADNGQGTAYALEVADACEQDSYTISKGTSRPISVSNFLLPGWFDPMTPAGTPVDYLRKLPAPFTLDAGGYVVKMVEGQASQQFGELSPTWKQEAHALVGSRGARRMARGEKVFQA
jgi:hypothetical protein